MLHITRLLVKTNYMIINSNHPTFSTCKDVIQISKPLKELGIIYFDYTRSDNDGGRIWLTNHASSTERYLTKKYYLCGNVEGLPSKYKPQIVFLDTLPKQYIYDDVIRSHDIDHAMQIINPQENSCEFFGFATKKGNTGIINTYLTKLDMLKKFCAHFVELAQPLIKLVEKNKIILPFHSDSLDFLDKDDSGNELNYDSSSICKNLLPKRQLECARLLIAGKKIREIAVCLNLSPRTVEHYLNHLKKKLDCRNKTELIIKLAKMINNGALL